MNCTIYYSICKRRNFWGEKLVENSSLWSPTTTSTVCNATGFDTAKHSTATITINLTLRRRNIRPYTYVRKSELIRRTNVGWC